MEKTLAAKVHWLTFTSYWFLLYFLWKVIICLLYVIGIDYDNSNTLLVCKLLIIIGIWAYTIIAVYLFYFIHIKNNGQNPYFFRHPVKNLSFFIPIIHPNISQTESKYTFIKYLIFFIGITMILISIILDFSNIKMNDIISIWHTICFIPLFVSIIMHQMWTYLHSNAHQNASYWISTLVAFAFLWIFICIILQNDFNINFNSLYITIPIIILSICFDILLDFTVLSQTQMIMFTACLCFAIPAILMAASWMSFIVLFHIYFVNDNMYTMAIVFIPIWVVLLFQACHLCFGVAEAASKPKDFISKHEYGKSVIVSTFDDLNTLNKLNKALQHKRDAEIDNTMIDLSPIIVKENNQFYDSLMIDKVYYRLRCKDIVADIISPNHVSLNKKAYQLYTKDNANAEYTLKKFFSENMNEQGQMYGPIKVDRTHFYQWIPTQFQVTFKNNVTCVGWKDVKTEYIDIKLNSLYIADVNQFKYENLSEIIINILKTKIISLFIHSIVGCCANEESDEYKQLLFEWCSTNKILNIIVKCQQYEFGDDTQWDYNISNDYHIDGTIQEKISHIAILYTYIDDCIRGGDLNLAFDSYLNNVWKFKPKQSSIIVFPNMYHKIDQVSVCNWKWNKYKPFKAKQKRRILSFFLCCDEYFSSTVAYNALSFTNVFLNEDNEVNQRFQMISELPLLTTKDVLPFDKEHCNVLLTDIVTKIWKDIPSTIVVIIMEYVMDNTLLRNKVQMEMNARCLREYRRHFVRFTEARRPMVCD